MIGDDVLHALPTLRHHSLSLMRDRCTISRPGAGGGVLDPNTGLLEPAAATTVHTVRCRVRQPNAVESDRLYGEREYTASRFIVVVPWGTTGVRVGDEIRVTATDDADLLSRTLRVLSVPMETNVVDKAYPCEVVE